MGEDITMSKCRNAIYDSRTDEIRQQITEGINPFINQMYTNSNGFKWLLNARGYFHIWRIESRKADGKIYYVIQHYRLKPDGMLADSGYSLFMTHTETKEAFDVIKNLLPDKKEEE